MFDEAAGGPRAAGSASSSSPFGGFMMFIGFMLIRKIVDIEV